MKKRLDQLVLEQFEIDSRQKAQAIIMAGKVKVNTTPVTKPGQLIDEHAAIHVDAFATYISRGGDKLAPVLNQLPIHINQRVCIDIGASTGGFTDVLLKKGAKKVYTVDVGTNQLAYELRIHPNVTVYENLHANDMTPDLFNPPPSFAVVDVSFISITRIIETVLAVLTTKELVLLVKPQFEIGDQIRHFKGVVKSHTDQLKAVDKVSQCLITQGLSIQEVIPAPIKGPKGNQEYFIWAKHSE